VNTEIHISSLQNPTVKLLLELQQKSRSRNKYKKFVVEGINEIRLCIHGGFKIDSLFYSEHYTSETELISDLGIKENSFPFVKVSNAVFEKIAYRKDVKNAIALVAFSEKSTSDIVLKPNMLLLVAEGIEKPGNLGAILRSADAMGADAVILCDPRCDIYNPNVIRGSVGSVFAIPVISCKNITALEFLQNHQFQIFTTFMESAKNAWNVNFVNRSAILVGTESTGLTDFWKKPGHQNVNIPMFGKVDSLNVSVAVSLLLYEARKQMETNEK